MTILENNRGQAGNLQLKYCESLHSGIELLFHYMKRFKITFSIHTFQGLGISDSPLKGTGVMIHKWIFSNFSIGTFMQHNFMNKGTQVCNLAGI